jgi:hypothetical protein
MAYIPVKSARETRPFDVCNDQRRRVPGSLQLMMTMMSLSAAQSLSHTPMRK